MPKEIWIEIHGRDVTDSFKFTDFKPAESLAIDPSNPNVDFLPVTPGPDDLTGLPAVQADVDGRDFLVWQRSSPNVDTDTLDLM